MHDKEKTLKLNTKNLFKSPRTTNASPGSLCIPVMISLSTRNDSTHKESFLVSLQSLEWDRKDKIKNIYIYKKKGTEGRVRDGAPTYRSKSGGRSRLLSRLGGVESASAGSRFGFVWRLLLLGSSCSYGATTLASVARGTRTREHRSRGWIIIIIITKKTNAGTLDARFVSTPPSYTLVMRRHRLLANVRLFFIEKNSKINL